MSLRYHHPLLTTCYSVRAVSHPQPSWRARLLSPKLAVEFEYGGIVWQARGSEEVGNGGEDEGDFVFVDVQG